MPTLNLVNGVPQVALADGESGTLEVTGAARVNASRNGRLLQDGYDVTIDPGETVTLTGPSSVLAEYGATTVAVSLVVSGGGGSGGVVIQDEGVALTTRAALNFVGSGVTATDDAAGSRTKVAVPSGARMKSGLWYPAVGQSGVATATYVRDAIYFMPFLLPGALDGIALEVTTAAPGAVIRLGFYDDTGFGEPRNLLGSEQTVSGDTIGGKVVTFAPVSGEVIWTAVVCQVADAGFRDAFPVATAPVATDSALEAVRGFGVSYRSLGFSGALPATASGLQYLNNAPRTAVRAA